MIMNFGTSSRIFALTVGLLGGLLGGALTAQAQNPEVGLDEKSAPEDKPSLSARLPEIPRRDPPRGDEAEVTPGGRLTMLMGGARDLRQINVYGYTRLLTRNADLKIEPDILRAIDNQDDRVFTFHLRPGHRWSDGHPFTSEDFRYWWENIANNEELSPVGPPQILRLNGQLPEVSFPSPTTVRYSWQARHPLFFEALAATYPLLLFAPAHYLKHYHQGLADPAELELKVRRAQVRSWAALHNKLANSYKNLNPELPVLDPWVVATAAPAEQFLFRRNPYFHRVDAPGRQLPYIDEINLVITAGSLIPAKTAAGDSDLQARYLSFSDYTFLKRREKESGYQVRLWNSARGGRYAIFPNLTTVDAQMQSVLRDPRVRRALSLAINRAEINQVVYYGLARESNNLLLPESPLYHPPPADHYGRFDLVAANRLLDEAGLTTRDRRGYREIRPGQRLVLIVETAQDSDEVNDILQLVTDSWEAIGVELVVRKMSVELMRNRIYAGKSNLVLANGLENGLSGASTPPKQWTPVAQDDYQWPRWGQYHETGQQAGVPPDTQDGQRLYALYQQWLAATGRPERRAIWTQIIAMHEENVYSFGTIAQAPIVVVVRSNLKGLPLTGLYNWDPGSFFGIHRMDRLWLSPPG